jgi:hypothetical protein
MVNTRTGAGGNDNDNTETGGSLSAGTGSATLGYKPNLYSAYHVLVIMACLVVIVSAFATVLAYMMDDVSYCSNTVVVMQKMLVLVFFLSFLWINARRKMTKYSTSRGIPLL